MDISWEEIEEECRQLCDMVAKNAYDGIVCISTGGLIPGKIMSELLDLPLGIVTVKRYGKNRKKLKKMIARTRIIWSRNPKKIEKVLLIDDIIDEGKTMEKVIQDQMNFTSIKEIDICALFQKTKNTVVDFSKHNLVVYCGINEWVVFPWEELK